MIVGIHHTALSTPDLDRLIAFYRDQIGFEIEFEFAWDESNVGFQRTHAVRESAGRVAMLRRGGARVEIFEYRKPIPRSPGVARANADHGIAHLCVEVKGIEAEVARLAGAGMTFQSEPVPQGNVKCCYGRDPDGNLIELLELFDHVVE